MNKRNIKIMLLTAFWAYQITAIGFKIFNVLNLDWLLVVLPALVFFGSILAALAALFIIGFIKAYRI